MIKTNGYYISEGKYFEDLHVGHKDEGFMYSYLKLTTNGVFVKATYKDINVNFLKELSCKTKQELLEDTSIAYGKYALKDDKVIEFKYRLMDKWDMCFELEIIALDLLRDSDGIEYHFVEVDV